ncbi:selenium-dependent molybdenum cofactor biosynthesis protein YqeB [Deferribacteres bacterium DY0037]
MQKTSCKNMIILRGGGDLATGIAVRLFNSGFQVTILETAKPTFIRRTVSLGMAVYNGEAVVEEIRAELHNKFTAAEDHIPVIVDPDMKALDIISPLALVDAIIAKKNTGLSKGLADIVIALGPGFTAGTDCHVAIETMRGHNLGRVLYVGKTAEDTGTPGVIKGIGKERVIHAPCSGKLRIIRDISEIVQKDETIALIDNTPVKATIEGIVRGMIMDGHPVHQGMKIADIDPRQDELENCYTVSDKARSLGGSVLEAVLHLRNGNDN